MQRGPTHLVPGVGVGSHFKTPPHALDRGPLHGIPVVPVACRVSRAPADGIPGIGVGPERDELIRHQDVALCPRRVKRRPALSIPRVRFGTLADQRPDDGGVHTGQRLQRAVAPPGEPRRGVQRGVASRVLRMDVGASGQQCLDRRRCSRRRGNVNRSVPRPVGCVHVDPAFQENDDRGRTRLLRRRMKRSLALAGAQRNGRPSLQQDSGKRWVLAIGRHVQWGPSHVVLNVGIGSRRQQPRDEPALFRRVDVPPLGHCEVERGAAYSIAGTCIRSRTQQGICNRQSWFPLAQRGVQRRRPVGPFRIHRHTLVQQERDHRRISRSGRFVQRAVPLLVACVWIGPRLQQEPDDAKVAGSRRKVDGRIPVVVGGPRIGARPDQPNHHSKVRSPFGAPGTGHVPGILIVRLSQDGMVQRRAAVPVTGQRVRTRRHAADDVGGERHTAEHPHVPVIAVGGVGHLAVLVTGGRIGPEPQEFASDKRVRIAPCAVQRRGLVAVPRVEIGAEFDEGGNHRRVCCVPRGTVQQRLPQVVRDAGIDPRAQAGRNLLGRGRSEEVPGAQVIAGLGNRRGGQADGECNRDGEKRDGASPGVHST